MKYLKYFGILAALALIACIAFPAEAHTLLGLDASHIVDTTVGIGAPYLGYVSVAAIKRTRGANPGGLVEFYIIDKDDLLDLPAPADGKVTITAAITAKPGKGFTKWEFAQDTGDFNFKLSGDPGSQSFEHTVGIYIPRFTPEIAEEYNKLPNGEYVIIKVDANGNQIVNGDLVRPMIPNLDYKSGKKFNDKNGAEVGFAAGNGHVPYFYTGEIPVLNVIADPGV